MSKPIREGKRPFKTGKQIGRVFIFIALGVAAIVATQLIIALMGEAHRAIHPEEAYIAGTKDEAPDYAIKNFIRSTMTFPTGYQYAEEGDVLFAITLASDRISLPIALIRDSESRRYRDFREIRNILSMGESTYSLLAKGGDASAILYKDQGNYIISAPIGGPFFEGKKTDTTIETIDINEVEVYDNLGNPLKYLEGDNLKYYFYVGKELPENYKIYMKYKDREYLLLDTNKPFVLAGADQ